MKSKMGILLVIKRTKFHVPSEMLWLNIVKLIYVYNAIFLGFNIMYKVLKCHHYIHMILPIYFSICLQLLNVQSIFFCGYFHSESLQAIQLQQSFFASRRCKNNYYSNPRLHHAKTNNNDMEYSIIENTLCLLQSPFLY